MPQTIMAAEDIYKYRQAPTGPSSRDLPPRGGAELASPGAATYGNYAEHACFNLAKLNEQRKTGAFCDVVLRAEGKHFPAHRSVLAAFSDYFAAMFQTQLAEGSQKEIKLKNVSAVALEAILDYMYTGSITIDYNTVDKILPSSDLLLLSDVKSFCADYLEKNMDCSNCLGVRYFAETYRLGDLAQKSEKFVLANFPEVMTHDEVLELPLNKLEELLTNEAICIREERLACDLVLRWAAADPDKRVAHLARVLALIRLPQLSPYYIHDSLDKNPLLAQSSDCKALVEEVKLYHLLPERRAAMRLAGSAQPRACNLTRDVIVLQCGKTPASWYEYGVNMTMCYMPDDGHWFPWPPTLTPRINHCAIALEGAIYAIGGMDHAGNVLRSAERFDLQKNAWYPIASMSVGRYHCAVAEFDGQLYVSGGITDHTRVLPSVERYDPGRDEWTTLAPMTEPRFYHQFVRKGDRLFVLLGRNSSYFNTSTVEIYDVRRDQWSVACQREPPVELHPTCDRPVCTLTRNLIHLIHPCGASVAYDDARSTWMTSRVLAPVPGHHPNYSFFMHGRVMYAFGPHLSRCYSYDIDLDKDWKEISPLPVQGDLLITPCALQLYRDLLPKPGGNTPQTESPPAAAAGGAPRGAEAASGSGSASGSASGSGC
ncbi:PREDICTED: kelch-like protein diablo [Branchiostoma belcheri]|uniref:Kelch-like protein diablo n=1 Tax=Branchiostoma belcheri TaxID=7741 RepID=A0A6P5A1Y3_BRABE|nr:PREDICTED: kelch-like protein diablo [Branchiostoma belcheri]